MAEPDVSYPPSRGYRTRVSAIRRLSPHFLRVTVTAPELSHFGSGGWDQRFKVLLPAPDGAMPDLGLFQDPAPPVKDWFQSWRVLPDAQRSPMRTYTVRAVRHQQCEVDIDFVLHGTEGPASAWADQVAIGDLLHLIGGDLRSPEYAPGGVEWKPAGATSVLLAGDETAAPAICAILESLGAEFSGAAFIEVPDAQDALEVHTEAAIDLHWLPRRGTTAPAVDQDPPHGALLIPAVRDWVQARLRHGCGDSSRRTSVAPGPADLTEPEGEYLLWEVGEGTTGQQYAWLAGEAGAITGLRRVLVSEVGLDRATISFMGYWRRGRAEN